MQNFWAIDEFDKGKGKLADYSNKIFANIYDVNKVDNFNFSETFTHDTLFSALISKPSRSGNGIDSFSLDIPDLPVNADLYHWQIPKTNNYEWIDYHTEMVNTNHNFSSPDHLTVDLFKAPNDDEGFCSTKCSPNETNCINLCESTNYTDQFWSDLLTLSSSEYVNWETRKE